MAKAVPAQPSVAARISRRHVTGSESARGLLFTVLGEFVLTSPESTAWTSAFIEVLGRLGVEEKAARQALMRTAADGWLESERVGRRTRWGLTGNGKSLLREGTERIYGFRPSRTEWDGCWLIVHVRVPDTERAARHHLHTRLAWAGLGDPTPGVWISPHIERQPEVERVISRAGLAGEAQIFTAHHSGGALERLVADAWDLANLESSYQQFLADFASTRAHDPLARTLELVHAWRPFPWIDPDLPGQLLPERWSGIQAERTFAHRHAKWAGDARTEWDRLNTARV